MKPFSLIYRKPLVFPSEDCFDVHREYLSSEQVDYKGRPITQSCYTVDVPSKRYNGLKVVDFALENQLLVGTELSKIVVSPSLLEIDSQIAKSNEKAG